LHLTDRKEDEYRFKIFDYLYTKTFDVLIILGDLCDAKDCHSGVFVNRVVSALLRFAEQGQEVHLLMGNHDYSTDPSCPFFLFLQACPNCYYHNTAQIWEIGNQRLSFFPHSRTPEQYWPSMLRGPCDLGVDLALCHQVFSGAMSESGVELRGYDASLLQSAGRILAGDVHVPQVVGPVEYVGAPYPIRFGDSFEPRMVLYDSGAFNVWSYLYPPSIQKLVLEISDPEQFEYNPTWREGDQVKIVLSMKRSNFGTWEACRRKIKKVCERNNLMLCGLELRERVRQKLSVVEKKPQAVPVSYADQFLEYCKYANIDKTDRSVGRELLEI